VTTFGFELFPLILEPNGRLRVFVPSEFDKVHAAFEGYCREMMPVEETKELDSTFSIMSDDANRVRALSS